MCLETLSKSGQAGKLLVNSIPVVLLDVGRTASLGSWMVDDPEAPSRGNSLPVNSMEIWGWQRKTSVLSVVKVMELGCIKTRRECKLF